MKRWRRWSIYTGVLLTALFGLAMCSTYLRQLAFGPKVRGQPIVVWEQLVLEADEFDHADDLVSRWRLHIHAWLKLEDCRVHEVNLSTLEKHELWSQFMKSSHAKVRQHAMISISNACYVSFIDKSATHELFEFPGILESLIRQLEDSDDKIKCSAIQCLNYAKHLAGPAVPRLVELLEDPNDEVRNNAAWFLGEVGSESASAIPILRSVLTGGRTRIRPSVAASSLAKIDPKELEFLDSLLNHERSEIRIGALMGIVNVWPKSKALLPRLLPILQERRDKELSEHVVSFSFRVYVPEATPIYKEWLHSEDEEKTFSAIWVLSKHQIEPELVLPKIRHYLDEREKPARFDAACILLGYWKEQGKSLIPDLLRLQEALPEDRHPVIRRTLCEIDPKQFPQGSPY